MEWSCYLYLQAIYLFALCFRIVLPLVSGSTPCACSKHVSALVAGSTITCFGSTVALSDMFAYVNIGKHFGDISLTPLSAIELHCSTKIQMVFNEHKSSLGHLELTAVGLNWSIRVCQDALGG